MSQLEAATTIESALEDAIRLLKRRRVADDVTLEELKDINVKLPQLEADLALVHAQIIAFLAQQGALPRPSDAAFAEIRKNAEKLDAIIAQNLQVGAVLGLITTALTIFRAAPAG
jgi:hypothetical protein